MLSEKFVKFVNQLLTVVVVADMKRLEEFESASSVTRSGIVEHKIRHVLELLVKNYRDYARYSSAGPVVEFPILTKDGLRNLRNERASLGVMSIASASGGSTGVPVTVCQSLYYWRINRANKRLIYRKNSDLLFPKIAMLWGEDGKPKFISKKRIYLNILNTRMYNTFRASVQHYKDWAVEFQSTKPDILEGYASSIEDFLLFGRPSPAGWSPQVVISTAGVLTPTLIRSIRSVWPNTKIVNRYGSREVGDIAWGVSKSGLDSPRLYINQYTHFVEVVDDNGCPCPSGVSGRILVTQLTNHSFPLVRYDIGDRGALSVDDRGRPYLSQLIGRSVDVFKGLNGERVDGEFFTHLFYDFGGVDSFQVIQREEGIVLNVRTSTATLLKQDIDSISKKISEALPGIPLSWKFNSEFVKDPSGKIRFTRCEI